MARGDGAFGVDPNERQVLVDQADAQQKPGAIEKAADAARVAVEQDGADVLVLGCMSMAFLPGICEELGRRVGVPVVNPVMAALKTAEALVSMRLAHSKAAWPAPKAQEIIV